MIYSLTAFSLFLASLYCTSKYRRRENITFCFLLAFFWLVLYEGLRWQIGTDWDSYYKFFEEENNSHMGVAYGAMNHFLKGLTGSFSTVTLSVSLFFYLAFFNLFRRYSPNIFMSLVLCYCSMIGLLGCNRQLLALTFCIFSLFFLFKHKTLLYVLFVVLASLFHITAIIFFGVYFLYKWHPSNKVIIVALALALVVGASHVINKLPFVDLLSAVDAASSGQTGLSSYVDSFEGGVSMIGVLKRLIIVSAAIYAKRFIKRPKYEFFLKMYVTGCVIFFVFNGSVLQLMAGRGAMYFNIFEALVIPYIITYVPATKVTKYVAWVAVFAVYFYLMWRDMNSYVQLTGVDIYNPYRSVLF